MKRLITTVAAGACALGLFADVIYVAPDGAGSGTSWADAAPVKAAFTAAVAAEGGEIWLKEGFYSLGSGSGLTVCSNLVVRGGFVGDETSADAADPKAHPTILSGMAANIAYGWSMNGGWPDDAHAEPLWKDGQFNLARPDDETILYRVPTIGNVSTGTSKMFSSSKAVTGLTIVGVTIVASRDVAVSLPAGSDFELNACRFLGCGCTGGASIGGPKNGVLATGGRVTMRGCEIVGCTGAVALSGTNASLTNVMEDCLFDDCTGGASAIYAGAIFVTGRQPLVVKGCLFKNNVSVNGGDRSGGRYQSAAAIAYTVTGGALHIVDTLFEGNRVRAMSTSTPNSCVYSKSPMTVERCMFKDNTIKGGSLDAEQPRAACLFANAAVLTVRDTVFTGNKISGKTATTTAQRWSTVAIVERESATFVNCSFYGNDISLDATTDAGKAAHFCGTVNVIRRSNNEDNSRGVTFVNCLFSENKLGANVDRQSDVVLDGGTHTGFTLSFINTVIWDDDADHQAYYASDSFPISISHSDLVNCTATAMTNGNNYVEYLTAVEPGVSPKPQRKCGTYSFRGMLGLDPASPFAKAGTPIYKKNGSFYFYAPGMIKNNPWRSCLLKSTSLAALDGATLVADGFGAARSADAFSYGPVVNRIPGLAVMLK